MVTTNVRGRRNKHRPNTARQHADLIAIDDLDLSNVPADPRWALLQDLDRAAHGAAGNWSAFAIRRRRDWYDGGDGAPPILGREVTITFDSRMSMAELIGLIRAVWGYLREEGKTVRTARNRQLGERKIALVRHVCLDAADQTWTDRWEAWNRKHRAWRYDTLDAFITECHDAEEQLVGARRGLAWFYDGLARVPKREVDRLAKEGDTNAVREKARRADEWVRQVERMGIEVVRHKSRGGTGDG